MLEKGFPINERVDGWVSLYMAERWMGGKSLVLPSALGCGSCEGLTFAWDGAERGSPPHRYTLPMLFEPAAGRVEPALGSLPGMGFLGEVPTGKGRSLNHWAEPVPSWKAAAVTVPCGHP